MGDIRENFDRKNLECPCCGLFLVNNPFLDKLQKARKIANIPFVVNSGTRCEKRNKKVKGKKTSSHLKGLAVDISAKGSRERFEILNALLAVGFSRIGIASNFIHVDDDVLDKDSSVIWVY